MPATRRRGTSQPPTARRRRRRRSFRTAAIHKIAHLNDGQYGNGRSWISNEPGKGWAQIELPELARIERIVWGRDRDQKFRDRLATDYRIEVSTDGESWVTVAGSWDRGAD